MGALIASYLPIVLTLYFLYRGFKESIYLLGIPFLMFFRYSVFFDRFRLFNTPGDESADVLLLFWLIFVWCIISSRSLVQIGYKRIDYYVETKTNWLDLIMWGIAGIAVINLFIVLNTYVNQKNVLTEFYTIVSLPVGYFIVKNISRYSSPETISKFLFNIVLVNSLASVFYLLHQGFHYELYLSPGFEEQESEVFEGETITRTFWFMPVLWFFSVAYLMAFRKEKPILKIGLLGINILAIFISYTRSFLMIAFLLLFIYFILVGIKSGKYMAIAKNFMIIAIAGVLLFLGLSQVLPASTNYFLGRFKELKTDQPADEESNTLLYRFMKTNEIINKVGENKKLIGLGPVSEKQLPWVEDMRATTADMVWTGVIFRFGYVGMGLFVLLYVIGMFKATMLFFKANKTLSLLGLVLLLTMISQIAEGFASWTFFNPGRFPLGLWYFGVLGALIGFSKKYELSTEKALVKYEG